MRRTDIPSDLVAFREAAANLLVHQDYAAVGASASIKFYRDRLTYHNPGHAFADEHELLEPGGKDVRNPLLCRAFRMIGIVEQAGTGIPTLMRRWQQLGYLPPKIHNDKERRSFDVTMLRELLLSDEQIYFQASLGMSLTDEEARVFAYATSQRQLTEFEAKTVLSLPTADARKILQQLVFKSLLTISTSGSHWVVADRLQARFTDLRKPSSETSIVTDQAPEKTSNLVTRQVHSKRKPLSGLTGTQVRILQLCASPRGIADLLENIKVTNRTFFRRTHLSPLMEGGILKLRYPDNPKHPRQAYLLTEAGFRLLENHRARQKDRENTP